MIGLNGLAEAMTCWKVGAEVTSADAKLLSGAAPQDRGAQYLTYGRYAPGAKRCRLWDLHAWIELCKSPWRCVLDSSINISMVSIGKALKDDGNECI